MASDELRHFFMASDELWHFLKNIWGKWELQFTILLSLLLQIILILSANRRKRSYSKPVAFVLWMAYLCADWVAIYSLGIISRTLQGLNDPDSGHNPDVLAFWTPFLLLHLGGPDTITAFSLEDSQLWLRHLLTLIFQFIAVGYIFMTSLHTNTKLFFPTIFVLAAGVLKYGERTWSLKKASADGLRKSLIKKQRTSGPDYAPVMEDFSSNLREGKPGMLTVEKENKSESEYYNIFMKDSLKGENSNHPEEEHPELVYGAHLFFETFKCLFVDLILTFQDRECSVFTFSKFDSPQAYKMIEIELNYAYDMFYTKALVVHSSNGRIIRAISFCSITIAFALFFSSVKHHNFQEKDIIVSYVLLAGALALEVISILMFIFSDWTVVMLLRRKPQLKWLAKPVFRILSTFRWLSRHRWSNHMGQYSLLSYTMDDKHKRWECFLDRLGLMEMLDGYMYINHDKVSKEMMELIFEYLKDKADDNTEDLDKEDKRLNIRQCPWAVELLQNSPVLRRSIDTGFDEILIMWHVATDICFQLQKNKNSDGKKDSKEKFQREASIVMSRYLLYLLISRPSTMSSIAGLAVIRHGDTCEEAKKFFKEERVIGDYKKKKKRWCLKHLIIKKRNIRVIMDKSEAMIKSLMDVHTYVPAVKVKGDKSKSILWDAVELARELQYLGEDKMWEITCNVWIEMLLHTARHCRGNYHAQTLSAGGELLTFVWLLQAHFGMGGHYQIKSGDFKTIFTMPEQQ